MDNPVKPLTAGEIAAVAKDIYKGHLLVVDGKNPIWQDSLGLLLRNLQTQDPPLEDWMPGVGMVVVPVQEHLGLGWIDEIPAVTLTCQFINQVDTIKIKERLLAYIDFEFGGDQWRSET